MHAHRSCKLAARPALFLAALLCALALAGPARADTYSYTPTNSTTDTWTTGTDWSATPVSNLDTALDFGPMNIFPDSALTNINTNDFGSPFLLNTLTLRGFGSSTAGFPVSTTITGGTLNFVNSSAGVAPQINLSAFNGAVGSTVAYAVNSNITLTGDLTLTANFTAAFSLGGVISGAGGLTKSGTNTVTLSGKNTYTGDTMINRGTLRVGQGGVLSGGNITFGGGTLQFGASFTSDYSARIVDSTDAIVLDTDGNFITFASALGSSNTGGLTKLGAGTLSLNGNNTYTGSTTISGGTLRLIGTLGQTGVNLTAPSATFDISSGTKSIGSLAGTGGSVVLGSGALTAGGNNTSTTFAGVISGTGSFTKSGTGTLILSGANIHTGTTTISGGRLAVDGSIATSALTTVNSGGILGGHGTVGAVVLASGGTISPGNSPGTMTSGNETWSGGAGYVWELNSASDAAGAKGLSYDWLNIDGTLAITATTAGKFTIYVTSLTGANVAGVTPGFVEGTTYHWAIATSTGLSGFDAGNFAINTSGFSNNPNTTGFTITQSGNILLLNYTAVPEPATCALGIVGLLGGLILLRRRPTFSRR